MTYLSWTTFSTSTIRMGWGCIGSAATAAAAAAGATGFSDNCASSESVLSSFRLRIERFDVFLLEVLNLSSVNV